MTDEDYARKLDELDTLLNDPEVPMDPARIWSLLAELSQRERAPRPAALGSQHGGGGLRAN